MEKMKRKEKGGGKVAQIRHVIQEKRGGYPV